MATIDLGMVTAYAYAVAGGYTGTEAEFEELLGNIADDLAQIENLQVTSTTLPEGSSATASYTAGHLTLGIPRGNTGATGATGAQGIQGETGNGIASITLTSTSGAVHTYTITFTDGTTTTFDVTDGEVTSESLAQTLEEYAKVDGAYEGMTVGNAEQLVSTVMVEDSEPYTFRTSGGSADIGNREYDEIVGGTVAWNQLVNPANYSTSTVNGVTLTKNADGTCAISGTATANTYFDLIGTKTWTAHKYLLKGCPSGGSASTYALLLRGQASPINDFGNGAVWDASTYAYKGVQIYVASGTALSTPIVFKPQFIDLTQMFGSTIADYIYSLETATAGAGVAFFRKFFPNDYYEYNAGELKSVEGLTSHDTVGFNAYDYASGTAKVVGGQQYQITGTYTAISLDGTSITPNASGIFTPSASGTLTVTGGNDSDTCVHLVWSGYRNGEYEPYIKHTYPLDSSLTLRGIPKLTADGTMYYDGDVYESDGTVTRRYGVIDLGTLNWIYYASGNYFYANVPDRFENGTNGSGVCDIYPFWKTTTDADIASNMPDKHFGFTKTSSQKYIELKDSAYTTVADFKQAMTDQNVKLVYELATPTTETATPFASPQIVDDFGTEEYVTTSIVPVGHNTEYPSNLRDKLQHLPDLADSDGYYLIQQSDNDMSLIAFHIPRATGLADGTYTLKATVSNGTPTYTWEAEE